MSSARDDVGYVPVAVPGFVSPGLVDTLRSGVEGTVGEGGRIQLDDHDHTLCLSDTDEVEPGTRVYVRYFDRRRATYCRPSEEREREQRRKERRRELKQKARERVKDWRRRRAEAFWEDYDLPFEYDIAQKGQRSQLQRGSTGTGTTSQTVNHLYVLESFEQGRLKRKANRYLCDNQAEFRFTEVRGTDSDGESFVPRVTCKTCLSRMERFQTNE
ncbi:MULTISPECIES: hypothetical protein [unclassified Haloferax]|jgi:hypothetical protein|uniref:hypothetical protein n=1 Tax=unclassified Haloferax TaxID=2625095 RepID=UPI0028761723|nr:MULTISPECIES: hypothetical protein [unclassified Haloferax]MDS0243108.1 hypothetical protein [Haloferax sp. S2CR25]MDS0446229.1 hypothetical protein [Haloferax sp. S2CR25-2]